MESVIVIGGGLAGSECALQLAQRNIPVKLYEMRPHTLSPCHHTDLCAELVCSNSFKSQDMVSAAGLLKYELKSLGSVLYEVACAHQLGAGKALAVDRSEFSYEVTRLIEQNPNIELIREEVTDIPDGLCVIAAGPLCSDKLFDALITRLGAPHLSFYDAAAPIVDADSLDMSKIFVQSRYSSSEGDYLNCPMDVETYTSFVRELADAQRVLRKDFENQDLFSACQPVEEVARSGIDSLRFGALKPVGLCDPKTGKRPYAAVQLRAETAQKTCFNLVGFQTNLIVSEQQRVFSMIPGLTHAEFLRYGVMHRNSFVDAPHCLDTTFAIPHTAVRLAGQICGTEGYSEAIASGLFAALNTYCHIKNLSYPVIPEFCAWGSLVRYATSPLTKNYQPMHVNFGLFPPLESPVAQKKKRRAMLAERSIQEIDRFVSSRPDLFLLRAL